MRKHGRIDANHREIVEALEAIGATVQSLADIGNGCPDLLVGYSGFNLLMECKDGAKPPSAMRLTAAQQRWFLKWQGQVSVVETPQQAVAIVKLIAGE